LFLALVFGGLLAIAGACTSSGSPGSGGSDGGAYTVTNCPSGGVLGIACATCIETSCASELSAVNGACASVLACVCPLGVDASACTASAACTSSLESAAASCTSCSSQCGLASDAGVPETSVSDSGVDAAPDATLDGGTPAEAGGEDGGPTDLTWAQWPMPGSPVELEAGASNPESYTAGAGASAGTVTDNVTGLMWQQTPTADDGGTFPQVVLNADAGIFSSYPVASTYCATLNLAGYADWRLPTGIELVSILDYSVVAPEASINATYFPNTPPTSNFWSATPVANNTGNPGWAVIFGGSDGIGIFSSEEMPYYVRCVRGGTGPFASSPAGAPPGRYTTAGSGTTATVYDTKTKLTWQQTPTADDGGTFPELSQASAASYCAGSSLNGAPGRLPTVNELLTLMDFSQTGGTQAMVDPTFFPSTPLGKDFWSSTPDLTDAGWAYLVHFDDGGSQNRSLASNPNAVRCVR
jgi:hypothetical protein